MKSTDKLSKGQVLQIPKRLPQESIQQIADDYGVSWQAIWYWVKQLKKRGYKVNTRKKGQTSLLDKKI